MRIALDKPFEGWGSFWLPGREPHRIKGRLIYKPDDGVTVELTENPRAGVSGVEALSQELPVLHGVLATGEPVTLDGSRLARTETHVGVDTGIAMTHLAARCALIGTNVKSPESLQIGRYSFGLDRLDEWLGPHFFDIKCDEGPPRSVRLEAQAPNPISASLPHGRADVELGRNLGMRHSLTAVEIHSGAYIQVRPRRPITLNGARDIAWQLQCLLSLLADFPFRIVWWNLAPFGVDDDTADRSPISLLYQQRLSPNPGTIRTVLLSRGFEALRDSFPRLVEQWFQRSDQHVLATDLYFSSQLHEAPSVNVKFLAITQAIEAYHRSRGTGLYMGQGEFDKLIGEMCGHIPSRIEGDHRQSLKARLKYANEYSLRKRLLTMLEEMPEPLRGSITSGDLRSFVARAVGMRNYYTHYGLRSTKPAWTPTEIFSDAERLRALLVASLLRDLGAGADVLCRMVSIRLDR